MFGNPLILFGVAAELGLLLFTLYAPAGNWLFGPAPNGVAVWLYAGLFAIAIGAAEKLCKA